MKKWAKNVAPVAPTAIYIYIYAARCLIEPQILTPCARNMRERSAKWVFLKKFTQICAARFGVQLSTHEFWLHFCPFFFAPFRGSQLGFCPALAPGWPGITAGTTRARSFFWAKCSGNAEGSRNPWVIKFHGRLGC